MTQIDMFGAEHEIVLTVSRGRLTIKEGFRKQHGYIKDKYCKNCKHHNTYYYHGKNYHKCSKIGETHSTATDIRLKDLACDLYEEEE